MASGSAHRGAARYCKAFDLQRAARYVRARHPARSSPKIPAADRGPPNRHDQPAHDPPAGPDQPTSAATGEETPYTKALGDALESLFDRKIHDLDGVVAGLNDAGVEPPDGGSWTAERFTAEMARLGA